MNFAIIILNIYYTNSYIIKKGVPQPARGVLFKIAFKLNSLETVTASKHNVISYVSKENNEKSYSLYVHTLLFLVQTPPAIYKCCDKTFDTEKGLKIHQTRMHGKPFF